MPSDISNFFGKNDLVKMYRTVTSEGSSILQIVCSWV